MATASSSRTTLAPAMAPAEKLGKFFGVHFKRWQQKMFFYLTTLSLQHFISEDVPVLGEETPENERFVVMERKKSSSPKNYPSKKKFKGSFHNCGKVGHKAVDYRAPKKDKKKSQANMVEKNDEMEDLCAMLSECSLVGNPKEWWIDSGSTCHICANKELFASYVLAGPDETIFMGNSATTKIEGVGKIYLKMTSSKVVTLNNVLIFLKFARIWSLLDFLSRMDLSVCLFLKKL
nr:uncharacterized protein LOC117280647 [Nicotiana tomentosiformis]